MPTASVNANRKAARCDDVTECRLPAGGRRSPGKVTCCAEGRLDLLEDGHVPLAASTAGDEEDDLDRTTITCQRGSSHFGAFS